MCGDDRLVMATPDGRHRLGLWRLANRHGWRVDCRCGWVLDLPDDATTEDVYQALRDHADVMLNERSPKI